MITGKNYVGSQLLAGGTKTYKTINPQWNIENPWTFTEASPEEIEQAAALADSGEHFHQLDHPICRSFGRHQRYSGQQGDTAGAQRH